MFAAAPADITVECIGDVPAPFALAYTDNCDAAGTVTCTDSAPVRDMSCGDHKNMDIYGSVRKYGDSNTD